jgi:hypothetical protein
MSGITAGERRLRSQIAAEHTHRRDPTLVRAVFDEAQSNRLLREQAERLVAARVTQGLEPKITDPATLAVIASLLTPEVGGGGKTTHAPATDQQKVVGTLKNRPGSPTRAVHAAGGTRDAAAAN